MSAPVARLVLALLLGIVAAGARAGDDVPALDGAVDDALKYWHVPGVAVAVVRDGKAIYLSGRGLRDVQSGAGVTADTVFPLASCSKAFTSTALAILVDEGKLSWDDPVRKHIAFFHLSDPLADRDVRIRDLLCHRTGVGSHDLLWYRAPWSPEEAVRRVGLLPLDRPFRSAFQYQSTMFTAAGFAVRSASGLPWDDFVRTRILEPLEMNSTVLTSTAAAKFTDRATGYEAGEHGETTPMPPYVLSTPDAAGSVFSNARDLSRWLLFHLEDGRAGARRIVSEASIRETHTPQMIISMAAIDHAIHPHTVQMSYGMGWVIQDYRGRHLVSHGGIIDGFRCHLTLIPEEKIGIAILANLHRTRMNQALSNTLVDRLLALPPENWNAIIGEVAKHEAAEVADTLRLRALARKPETRPSLPLAAYAGSYEHPAFGNVRVSLENGRLTWKFNDFAATLDHYQYDAFTLPLPVLGYPIVRFAAGSGGAVEKMHVGGKIDVEFRRSDP